MQNRFFTFIMLTFLLFITTFGCKHEPVTNPTTGTPKDTTTVKTIVVRTDSTGWKCSPDTVYFQNQVLPILVSACARSGCHDAVQREKGYVFTNYANTINKGIVAGQATNSIAYNVMTNGKMPAPFMGIVVSQAQKDIVAKWINQGAKNGTCNAYYGKCDTVGGVGFAAFVQPIVQNKCQGCHSGVDPQGGIKLSTYTEIKASVSTGKFWGSINQTSGFSAMPKGAKLPACELDKIDSWIKRGALNN